MQACDELLHAVSSGRGVEDALFDRVMNGAAAISEIYADSALIPKAFAAVVFDVSTALYSAAGRYSEAEAAELFERFDAFCDAVRGILN
jgi:hypothetical protein